MARRDRGRHGGKKHWLDDRRNVAKIFRGLIIVSVLWLAADLAYRKHSEWSRLDGPFQEFDAWFGFFPIYGFVGAFLLVLAAKQLRRLLMRSEDYYERRRDAGGA